jgi:hypothetical protein
LPHKWNGSVSIKLPFTGLSHTHFWCNPSQHFIQIILTYLCMYLSAVIIIYSYEYSTWVYLSEFDNSGRQRLNSKVIEELSHEDNTSDLLYISKSLYFSRREETIFIYSGSVVKLSWIWLQKC